MGIDGGESGIAYGFYSLALFLVFASVFYLCLSYGLNMLTVPINKQIADGTMSSQTASAIGFGIMFFKFTPIFVLILTFLMAMKIGIEGRSENP